ncbi:zinc finger MYM-type protein 1-like [Amphiura filiformis]|uniref:zinc finger MYM-type protein 1-like n=1 Tax=Amphiura filiformis TaxID=82378 RepID=UPI003B21391F
MRDSWQVCNAITKLIKEQIQCYNLKEKLISQTYDGAATMRGTHGGVQTQMKETYPHAHFIHCYAHQLNLMMEQACTKQISGIRVFFANLAAFPLFFQGSPKRMAALKKSCQRRLPRAGATRWNFQSRTVNTVYESREDLVECLTEIKSGQTTIYNPESGTEENIQWDLETIGKASGLLKWLEDEQFMYFLRFFNRVMPHVDVLYGIIQSRNISVDMVSHALSGFRRTLTEIRKELCESQPSDQGVPSTSKRRRTSEGNLKASCIEACDVMIMQAEDRFSSVGNLIPLQLVDPTFFVLYASNFPNDKLDMVPKYYPMVSKNKLTTELQVLSESEDFHEKKNCLSLLDFLRENNLSDVFSEVYQLLQITVTTPLTSAESERCFSTLKRILTFLRNTMDQGSQVFAADLVQDTRNFNELVIDKFARLKNRRAEFLYKDAHALGEEDH